MSTRSLVGQRSIKLAYLEKIDPIIKSKLRYYSIKGMDRDDMMQEGRLAALEALKRWAEKPGRANITSWAWIYIDTRFKQLAKKAPNCEETVDDIEMMADLNAAEKQQKTECCEESWLELMVPWRPDQLEMILDYVTENELETEEVVTLLMTAMPRYNRLFKAIVDGNLALDRSADELAVSKQRVCQLQKKLAKVYQPKKKSEKGKLSATPRLKPKA